MMLLPNGLRRTAGAVAGMLLMLPLSGCFESPPQVVSLNPNNGSTNVAGDLPIAIGFDHSVDEASVLRRFSISPALPGCNPANSAQATAMAPASCRVTWSNGGTKVVIAHAGSPFAPNTKYTLRLAAGFFDAAGVANSLDHQWELTSGTAPLLMTTSPEEGTQAVSVDTPIVLSFSTYMSVPVTAASVTVSPPIPDTRVVPNSRDHGRFVVLPGRLMRPDEPYTLTVGVGATDEHGLHLARPGVLHFHTGGLDPGLHGVVRAGRPAEQPSEVILVGLTTGQPGDTPAASIVRRAPVCLLSACGAAGRGEPLERYPEADVSPDGRHLAVVAVSGADPAAPPRLIIEDLPGGADRVAAAAASDISWSPDSTRVSYQAPDGIHILTVATGADVVLPGGDPLADPVEWSADGDMLVLPVAGAGGVRRIDLADAALDIRYPLPSVLPPPLTRPVLDPRGGVLAVRRLGDPGTTGTWILDVAGGVATARRLGPDLTPVAWIDAGTLLAVADNGGAPGLVRVGIADGGRTSIRGPAIPQILTAVVAPSGRQVCYLGDVNGVTQAIVENADGSNATPLTAFVPGTLQADGVSFGG